MHEGGAENPIPIGNSNSNLKIKFKIQMLAEPSVYQMRSLL
jgi:hypothetical protein